MSMYRSLRSTATSTAPLLSPVRCRTLVVGEQGMPIRGILSQLAERSLFRYPCISTENGFTKKNCYASGLPKNGSNAYGSAMTSSLGYCSKANKLAKDIKTYLEGEGLRVLDWATAFRPGRTIMEEVRHGGSVQVRALPVYCG